MKTSRKKTIEHDEQVAFFQMSRVFYNDFPELSGLLYAIPNGGGRGIRCAQDMKAEGVRSGVPDICCAMPSCGYHSLYIEMKKPVGGTLSEEQKKIMAWLAKAGHLVVRANGREEAFGILSAYLLGKIEKGITEWKEAAPVLGRLKCPCPARA